MFFAASARRAYPESGLFETTTLRHEEGILSKTRLDIERYNQPLYCSKREGYPELDSVLLSAGVHQQAYKTSD